MDIDDTCLSAEPATSTSSCVNDDPPSKNPFPDDMKMPAREETTSSSYKRAASAVIARVTHKNETKSWLTSEEKAQRSNEYQRLYPNGKKSDSNEDNDAFIGGTKYNYNDDLVVLGTMFNALQSGIEFVQDSELTCFRTISFYLRNLL